MSPLIEGVPGIKHATEPLDLKYHFRSRIPPMDTRAIFQGHTKTCYRRRAAFTTHPRILTSNGEKMYFHSCFRSKHLSFVSRSSNVLHANCSSVDDLV